MDKDNQGTRLSVEQLAMGQHESHVFARILIAARRRSTERINDNDIYRTPVEDGLRDRCSVLRLE
jgi:hypothetical protein